MLMEILLELLKEQGITATLMIAAIFYFYKENRKLFKKNEELHEDILKEYKTARIKMLGVISDNTRVIEKFLEEHDENNKT